MTEERKLVYEFLEQLKIACPYFWETSKFLRRRRECPGREAFDKGREIIDRAVVELENKLQELQSKKED